MNFRVALRGFAESDRRSLASFLREADQREPAYRLVHPLADADVIIADGDSAQVVANVVDEGQLANTLFLGERRPAQAVWHVARPADPELLRQGLDEIVAYLHPGIADGATQSAEDKHLRVRQGARRSTRQARQAASAAADAARAIPPDVLVLDQDDSAREYLCALLEQFGFCAYPARNNSQALWLVETRRFRAAFLEIELDGSDGGSGIELCERMKEASRRQPGLATALFIVSARAQPADRVRAALAGADAFLVKPLRRGVVAGALEARGVVLPADARGGC